MPEPHTPVRGEWAEEAVSSYPHSDAGMFFDGQNQTLYIYFYGQESVFLRDMMYRESDVLALEDDPKYTVESIDLGLGGNAYLITPGTHGNRMSLAWYTDTGRSPTPAAVSVSSSTPGTTFRPTPGSPSTSPASPPTSPPLSRPPTHHQPPTHTPHQRKPPPTPPHPELAAGSEARNRAPGPRPGATAPRPVVVRPQHNARGSGVERVTSTWLDR